MLLVLGHTATVFGATGFLGRYIVNRLGTHQPMGYFMDHKLTLF